jgi:hypothetical protein
VFDKDTSRGVGIDVKSNGRDGAAGEAELQSRSRTSGEHTPRELRRPGRARRGPARPPRLVVIEGGDYAGKSTVARQVADSLRTYGYVVAEADTLAFAASAARRAVLWLHRRSVSGPVKSWLFMLSYLADLVAKPPRVDVVLQQGYSARVAATMQVRRFPGAFVSGSASRVFHRRVTQAFYLQVPYEERRSRWVQCPDGDPRDVARFALHSRAYQLALEMRFEAVVRDHAYRFVRNTGSSGDAADLIVGAVLDELRPDRSAGVPR